MKTISLKLDEQQLLSLLMQYSIVEIKVLIRKLFESKLYNPVKLEDVCDKAEKQVVKNKIGKEIIDEGIQWARSQK